eukprot:m.430054 g.430054  ORF g.430054 m.430054 type:complete len:105 (+) comp17111_c0_seq1:215-529(+)
MAAAHPTEEWDSKKQQTFVEAGLKDPSTQEYKKCIEMGGVGEVTAKKLSDLGFDYAYNLIGQYMVNNMDDEATNHWLENEVGVKQKNLRASIVGTMRKWCDQHL